MKEELMKLIEQLTEKLNDAIEFKKKAIEGITINYFQGKIEILALSKRRLTEILEKHTAVNISVTAYRWKKEFRDYTGKLVLKIEVSAPTAKDANYMIKKAFNRDKTNYDLFSTSPNGSVIIDEGNLELVG